MPALRFIDFDAVSGIPEKVDGIKELVFTAFRWPNESARAKDDGVEHEKPGEA